MSDEPIRLPEGQPQPAAPVGIFEHRCEHSGCAKWAGFGFSRPKQEMHWYCFAHRDEGEQYI